MKRLLVLRHAKAEEDSPSGKDFDRPLAERGWDDAAEVGRAMRKRGFAPDAIVASPAKRVVETLAALAEGYGALDPAFDQRIYNASLGTLFEVVRAADDGAQALLLVGHNPGLQLLLLDLTRGRIGEHFPTAALAIVDIAVASWADAGAHSSDLVNLIVR
jgi:phosphohistidine phosphatase